MARTHNPKRLRRDASEGVLLARARLGDQDAITALVQVHSQRLRWVAWRILRNWADVEDVVQTAWWKAYQHLPDYEERASLSTWLTRIVLNEAVGLLRKRRTQAVDLAGDDSRPDEMPWLPARTHMPDQIAVFHETDRIVRGCVDQIRPALRAVLCLRLVEELSHQEIAERLGLSVQAVKLRYFRGRRLLRTINGGAIIDHKAPRERRFVAVKK